MKGEKFMHETSYILAALAGICFVRGLVFLTGR